MDRYGVRRLACAFKAAASRRTPKAGPVPVDIESTRAIQTSGPEAASVTTFRDPLHALDVLSLAAIVLLPAASLALPGEGGADSLLAGPTGEVPAAIAGFPLAGVGRDAAIHLFFCPPGQAGCTGTALIEFLLAPRDDSKPAQFRTRSYDITYRGPMTGTDPSAETRPLVEAVVEAVRRNEGRVSLPLAAGSSPEGPPAWLVNGLVLLYLICLAGAGWGLVSNLIARPGGFRPEPDPAPVSMGLAGDIVILAGIAGFVAINLTLLPYDYLDLWYLFSLERGRPSPLELVHPVYLPVLEVYQALLRAVGYEGRMLVPVEFLNTCVAALSHWLLYRVARRISGNGLAAALAVLVFAACTGPWSAALRPTPYAWGLLMVVLTGRICLSDRRLDSPRYVALAGMTTGLAMGFHLSAMALVPAVVLCLVTRTGWRRAIAPAARFVRAVTAVLLVEYGLLATLHDLHLPQLLLGPDADAGALFRTFEQVPGTSLATSGSLVLQIETLAGTLVDAGSHLLFLLAGVAVVCLVVHHRSLPDLWRRDREVLVVAGLVFGGFAGFFLINNTRNGFVFASLALVPVALARLVAGTRWLVWAVLPFALVSVASGALRALDSGGAADRDPMHVETRFLGSVLGTRDVLIVPGCPHPELFYLRHLNVLGVSVRPARGDDRGCDTPIVLADEAFLDRIHWYQAHGSRVLLSEGDPDRDFEGDRSGAEKERQVFHGPGYRAADRRALASRVRALLRTRFVVEPGPESPQFRTYLEVRLLREGLPAPVGPDTRSGGMDEELERIATGCRQANDRIAADRIEYLRAWSAALTGDPYVACDLFAVLAAKPHTDPKDDDREAHGCTTAGGFAPDLYPELE
jgi:hypothetical protein